MASQLKGHPKNKISYSIYSNLNRNNFMAGIQILILIIFLMALVYSVWWLQKRKTITPDALPVDIKKILEEQVPFYQQLNKNKQTEFEERAAHFLTQVKITGVKTMVEDIDRVLIAASAIIPIFNFAGWEYKNLHEVLLYPD